MITAPNIADLNLEYTLPAAFLALFTCFLLLIDLFVQRKSVTAWLTLGALGISFILNLFVYNRGGEAVNGLFIADQFTGFMNIVILITAILTVFLSIDYLQRTGIERGEFYSLLLFSTSGMMFMAGANDLIVVFVALELLSIPLYIMAAFRPNDLKSEESGMKYFILGAFASAFFVYGAALIYGATGTTRLPEIFAAVNDIVAQDSSSVFYLLVGAALIIVGLGFKVAVVPFHMWTPDVYEGAPTPVTAFMSVGAKAGGFAALLRVMLVGLPFLFLESGEASATSAAWQNVIAIIAALTMIVGNIVAISQTNMKRLLAYSSIAHAGYILMAVAAGGTPGIGNIAAQGALIYMLSYAFTNLGAFGVVLALEREDGSGTDIEDFTGLAKSKPLLAAIMAIFMLSLTGIPLTAGFTGKWFIFGASIQADLFLLAVIGVLTSVISAFYYVRVIVNMYLRDADGSPAEGLTQYVTYAIYAAFAGTLLLGIFWPLATNLGSTVAIAAALVP
jgi:NADH-quinone oxidoreductase subunit N